MPSSSARAAAKKKGKVYEPSSPRKQPPVTQQERVTWALARVRAAQFKLNLNPHDPVLRTALASRKAEHEREVLTLERSQGAT